MQEKPTITHHLESGTRMKQQQDSEMPLVRADLCNYQDGHKLTGADWAQYREFVCL